ncbi:CaiB/BaiF CoA transferase family protein [Nocardioides caldifontis]|uniref:CaiB/BaiF CoA transferase family protein n=1 Tax=Nocardioides caldifontis TaxID=2588938 RepID=UPI001396CA8C|nr:CoA transferase [Nocardioides caldifontis]
MTDTRPPAAGGPPGPLGGIRVLDFTRHLAGPYATTIMGDFGADVIKIESVPTGDPARTIRMADEPKDRDGQAFIAYNHGKRSIAVDMRTEEGLALVHRMVADADVVVENYRPGVAHQIGIGYEELRAINPRIVYCSISAFGQEGPWAERPATDPVVQAMSGLISVTGHPGDPVRVGVPMGDIMGAMTGLQGILMALLERERSGEGQWIDVSLMHALAFTHTTRLAEYFATGKAPEGQGTAHSTVAPYEVFPTKDRPVIAGSWTEDTWPRFCKALGVPAMATDPRFATNPDRLANRPELRRVVTEIMEQRTAEEWEQEFARAGALFGPVLTVPQMLEHPQMEKRPAVTEVTCSDDRVVKVPDSSSAIRMVRTSGGVALPPPLLSEHAVEILDELGLEADEVKRLIESGAVRAPRRVGGEHVGV